MRKKYNPSLLPYARKLRREMTKEERRLWYGFLKDYPVHFYRQKVLGKYIVDFYCAQAKLAIELDGSQHYDEAGMAYDAERTSFLKGIGVRVIRIPNNELRDNFSGVCKSIISEVTI